MIATRKDRAFTLIELLVVISTIALLIALLIPAVQSAREAARRVQCINNLKQIGIGIEGHLSSIGTYPAGAGTRYYDGSFLYAILPFLEQNNLYNSINVTDESVYFIVNNSNISAMRIIPSTLVCPSEPVVNATQHGRTNYAGNAGFPPSQGIFLDSPFSGQAPRDITDGLSQTIYVAEWRSGGGSKTSPDRLGSVFGFVAQPGIEAFVQACKSVSFAGSQVARTDKGQDWIDYRMARSLYNHLITPNNPSCGQFTSPVEAITSGSYHPGGANVLAMDGSVHFVKDSIDPKLWMACGTKAAGEQTRDSFF